MSNGTGLSIGMKLADSSSGTLRAQARCSRLVSNWPKMQRRPTVLLIEENAAVRDALEQALAGEDFLVVPAATAAAALSKEQAYDLALIDVSSVRSNEFAGLRRLNHVMPRLPIVLISSQAELLNHPAVAHASARMLKPLEMPLLCRTVRDLTGNSVEGSRVLT